MDLIEFSTRRRVTIAMVSLTLVIFGAIALQALKVNLLPDLSYPTLTVRTEYTGAAPAEIETLITEPVEEAVGVVKNLRKLHSVSRTGQSDVILEFAWGTDMDKTSLEVRDKLEVLRLPLEVKDPVLLRFNPSTEPVMRLVLSTKSGQTGSEEASLMRLRRYADEELKKRLEPVEGVAAVKVSGGLEDEVQVQIDDTKLAQLNLSVSTVIERLAQENVNISGGRIEEGSQRYLVRTVNQFVDLEQMQNLLISNQNGVPVRLKDVAVVSQGYKERQAVIRLGGNEAIEMAIYKEGDANIVSVAEAVKKQLKALEKDLPRDADLTTVEDQSIFIGSAISEVKKEAVMGGILAILIIFFFLRDGWSTFVISLSLPVSIVATFFVMGQLDLSLNVMSLAGLALATGMVVDDSIVVLESIAKARERGLGILEAAIVGSREVSMAVVASTLTTVAVFFPLVFVEGVAGQLFKDQALTVSIALMISLLVSLTLIPMLSSFKATSPMAFKDRVLTMDGRTWQTLLAYTKDMYRLPKFSQMSAFWKKLLSAVAYLLKFLLLPLLLIAFIIVFVSPYVTMFVMAIVGVVWKIAAFLVDKVLRVVGEKIMVLFDGAANYYRRILPKALDKPVTVLASSAIAFIISMFLATTLGTDLIPQFAQDRFEMTAKLSPGTQLKDTDTLVKTVQQAHSKDEGVQVLYGVSGSGTRLDANPTESGENIAKLTVVMGQGFGREAEARQTEKMRETMAKYPDIDVKFSRPQLLSFSTPLEIELRGQDLPSIEKAGRALAKMLENNPHYTDVKTSVSQGFPEVQIQFDQERAAALGLTTRQIADQVVRKVRGEVATRYSFRDRKIDVLVRARENDRSSVDDIRRLIVNPQSDKPVTLSAVANVVETVGPSEINRVDQVRVTVVSSNLRGIDLGTAIEEVRQMVRENPLGTDIRMHMGGQGEELDASMKSLFFAFALAIFLVYLVMASQFESLLHPLVILFTVPLAMVGAFGALWLDGSPISVVVFIGLILLVGIVVKNAIVLIDKVNQLREEGVPKREAIMGGAESRLRPIIMTTCTTLFGFAPLAFLGGEGAEVKAPMAITVIGGLLVSTLLTLVVIPIVYNLLDRTPDQRYVERGLRAKANLAKSSPENESGELA